MKEESDSIKHYRAKEVALLVSSGLLLLSPFIKWGKPAAIKLMDRLEISLEISDELPALVLFYLSTVLLAFYVWVEWRRLDQSEKKSVQNWSFAAFEAFAVFALYWRYADLMKNTPYGKFSPLWFAPFVVLGFLFGTAISMFQFAFSLMRSREDAKRKKLPRLPRQAKEMFIGNILMLLVVLLPASIVAFHYYPGPTWWVPFVLLLVSIVPGLPTYGFLRKKHPDGTTPIDQLKAVTDMDDHMEKVSLLLGKDQNAKEFFDSLRIASAEEIQEAISDRVKRASENELVKCRTDYLGKIQNTEPPTLLFRRKSGSGEKEFRVEESVAQRWLATSMKALSSDSNESNQLSEKQIQKRIEDIGHKWANLLVDDIIYRDQGSSLLMERIRQKKIEDLEWIVLADPDINMQIDGCTPLLQATADGFLCGMELLIKHGANLEIANNCGMTPFLMAAKYNNWDSLKLLHNSGANIFAVNTVGDNALMIAASMGAKQTVASLLRWGLDPHSKNIFQKTALDFAEQSKSGEIATMIRRKMMGLPTEGAKPGKKKKRHK